MAVEYSATSQHTLSCQNHLFAITIIFCHDSRSIIYCHVKVTFVLSLSVVVLTLSCRKDAGTLPCDAGLKSFRMSDYRLQMHT